MEPHGPTQERIPERPLYVRCNARPTGRTLRHCNILKHLFLSCIDGALQLVWRRAEVGGAERVPDSVQDRPQVSIVARI